MIGWRDDLRWAFRYARRHPGFALAITSTLSISIAAAATAFGLASAVLWRPLPFHDASKLVFVWEETEHDGRPYPARVTGARYAVWRHPSNGLASMSLFGAAGFTVESQDGAMSVRGVRVSANYFDTLGIRPALGRTFAPADEEPGNHRVVILSHPLWQECRHAIRPRSASSPPSCSSSRWLRRSSRRGARRESIPWQPFARNSSRA